MKATGLVTYQRLIEQTAPFPPDLSGVDRPHLTATIPAAFPDPREPTHDATVILTGYDPNEQRVQWIPWRHAARKPGPLVPV